jgi:hypothetical protein
MCHRKPKDGMRRILYMHVLVPRLEQQTMLITIFKKTYRTIGLSANIQLPTFVLSPGEGLDEYIFPCLRR